VSYKSLRAMDLILPRNYAADFEPMLPPRRPFNAYRPELPRLVYQDAYVTHSGIGLAGLHLIDETVFRNVDPAFNHHLYGYALLKRLRERTLDIDAPNLLLVHNHWAGGYHHWITEALIKAVVVDPTRYTVLLPADYAPFAPDSLALWPWAGIVRVPAGHGVRARRLTVIGNPYSGHYHPQHLQAMRAQVLPRFPAAADSQRLYVTRRNDKLRRVDNEDQVIALLSRYGFRVIEPGRLGFAEQVSLFAGCQALISVHGAGITNCMFMPPGARVLELFRRLTPESPLTNPCYWHLATASGLEYRYQFCAHGQNNAGQDIDRVNIVVDLDRLRHNVEALLA
jgi:capsular polysaccharide biosynthesis protein